MCRWAKFELECLILTFIIHSLQFKIQSHLQKMTLWMPVQLIPKKKRQNFFHYHITFAICIFHIKMLWTLGTLESSFLDKKMHANHLGVKISKNFPRAIWAIHVIWGPSQFIKDPDSRSPHFEGPQYFWRRKWKQFL